MPSTSKKQARFMSACAHGWDSSACPPDAVAKKFHQADKKEREFICKDGCLKGRMAEAKKRARPAMDAVTAAQKVAPLYISRRVTNAGDIIAWAKLQGLPQIVAPGDMHVTIAYSRDPVDWQEVPDSFDHLKVGDIGPRFLTHLGDNNAIVLMFESKELQNRWEEIRDAGASWDYDGYTPHVTLTYDGGDFDIGSVAPYLGPIMLGPEQFEPINENWKDGISEIQIAKAALPTTLDAVGSSLSLGERMRLNAERSKIRASLPQATLIERMKGLRRMAEIRAQLGAVATGQPQQPRTPTGHFYSHDEKRSKGKRQAANNAAIALLARIRSGEVDAKTLTPADKETLAAYSGNGGALVGADGLIGSGYEYYTPKPIAEGCWTLLQELGFQGGKVLDPSAGTGIFGATAPRSAAIDAVELDETSGTINALVNEGAGYHVQVAPFEQVAAATPDETYDAVVTNVPFGDNASRGDNKKHDQRYRSESLENYFILRSLEKLRPGGLAVFVAPPRCVSGKGGKQESLRIRASYMAEFLGGYRLPNTVFAAANADTMTDVIAFRKHSRPALDKIAELRAQSPETLGAVNVLWKPFIDGTYFQGEGRRFVLGEFVAKDPTKFRDVDRVINPAKTPEIASMLRKFGPSRIDWAALDATESAPIVYQDGDTMTHGGQTLRFQGGLWEPVDGGTEGNAMDALLSRLVSPYHAFATEIPWADAERCVNYMIDASRALDVPEWAAGAVASLAKNLPADQRSVYWRTGVVALACQQVLKERLDDEEGVNFLDEYPDLSTAMQQYRAQAAKAPSTLSWPIKAACGMLCIHALKGHQFSAVWRGDVALDENQAVLTPEMRFERLKYEAKSPWVDIDTVQAEFQETLSAGFDPYSSPDWCLSPDGRQVMRADDYYVGGYADILSGIDSDIQLATDPKVKDKLLAMKAEAARRVDPVDPERMTFNLSSPYVSLEAKAEFLRRFVHKDAAIVTGKSGKLTLDINIEGTKLSDSDKLTKRFGDWLQNGTITLGGTSLNMSRGDALRELRRRINTANEQFDAWVHGNHVLMAEVQRRANDPKALRFRSTKDGDPLFVPGLHEALKPHPYQYAFIRAQGREFGGGNGFGVGLGKTLSALAAVQHVQNIGAKKKTLFVVPNSVLSNWRKEAVTGAGEPGTPGFKAPVYASGDGCLFIGWRGDGVKSSAYDEDLTAVMENRHSKIFMSYEAFERIKLRETTVTAYEDFMRNADASFSRSEEKKEEERTKGKLSTLMEVIGKKDGSAPYLEDMGVDSIVFDEAHMLKNSSQTVEFKSAKFLSLAPAAKRGLDAQAKCWYIRNGSRLRDGVLLLTATPITNSPQEIYSMLTLAVGHDRVNDLCLGIKGADEFMEAMTHKENTDDVTIDGIEKTTDVFTGLDNLAVLRKALGDTFAIEDAQSVGAQVVVPDRDEQATAVVLPPEIRERLQLYKGAFRYAIDAIMEKKPNRGDPDAFAAVSEHFGEPLQLIGHPFNLLNKMTMLIADPELDQRATFYGFAEDQAAKAEEVIKLFNKKPPNEDRPRLGPWTDPGAVVSRKTVRDTETGNKTEMLKVRVEAKLDDQNNRIVLDTLETTTILAFEKIAEKVGLNLTVSIPPKLAALLENVQHEEANPRGVTRDGKASPHVKQIVFCDVLALHPKIKRLLSTQAGIPAGKIAILTGKINNKPEEIIQLQDDFNATGEANKLRTIIANKKAEVGINLQNGTQAVHHLTIGWTPDSLEQRNGRGARQGNLTEQVRIYYYDAEGSFDSVKRSMVNKKANWIGQVLSRNGGDRVDVTGGLSREQETILIDVVGDSDAMARAEQTMAEREQAERVRINRDKQLINIDTIVKQSQWLKDNDTPNPMVVNKIIEGVLAAQNVKIARRVLEADDIDDKKRLAWQSRLSERETKLTNLKAEIEDTCTITNAVSGKIESPLDDLLDKLYTTDYKSNKFDAGHVHRVLGNSSRYTIAVKENGAIYATWKAEVDMAQAMVDNSLKQYTTRAETTGALPKALAQGFIDGTASFEDGRPLMAGCFVEMRDREGVAELGVTSKDYMGFIVNFADTSYGGGRLRHNTIALRRLKDYRLIYPGEGEYDQMLTRAAEIEDEISNGGGDDSPFSDIVPEVATRRKAEKLVKYSNYRHFLPEPYFPYVIGPGHPQTPVLDSIREQQKPAVFRFDDYDNNAFMMRSTDPVALEAPKMPMLTMLIDYAIAHGMKLTDKDFMSRYNMNAADGLAKAAKDYYDSTNPDPSVLADAAFDAMLEQQDSIDALSTAISQAIAAKLQWYDWQEGMNFKPMLSADQRIKLVDRIKELSRPKDQDPADDWVAVRSDYNFTKVVNIRDFATQNGEQAAWVGKKGVKPYDREVAGKLPSAPMNTWVIKRKVFAALLEQYPIETRNNNVTIVAEQSWT